MCVLVIKEWDREGALSKCVNDSIKQPTSNEISLISMGIIGYNNKNGLSVPFHTTTKEEGGKNKQNKHMTAL